MLFLTTSELNKNTFDIYPNPTNDILTINAEFPIDKVEVVDIHGKTLLTEREGKKSINTSKLEPGVYIIRITSDGVSGGSRFVKL